MDILVVLGMHRSGTSLVAGMLHDLGWDVGPDDQLMPPKPDNPRGFVEHMPAVNVNERLLRRHGGSWDEPPGLPAGWEHAPNLEDLHDEASEIIDRLAARGPDRLLLKDPRFSLTLPFWRTVTDIRHTVLPLRPPDAVVRSLLRRGDDMAIATAAELWTRYLLSGLAVTPTPVVVDADRFLQAPGEAIAELAAALGTDPDAEQLEAAASRVDPQLWGRRSGRPAVGVPDDDRLDDATRLHGLVTGDNAQAWRRTLARLTPSSTLATFATQQEGLETELRTRLSNANDRVEALRAELEQLRERFTRVRSERERARELHDAMRDQRDGALGQLERLRSERDLLRGGDQTSSAGR